MTMAACGSDGATTSPADDSAPATVDTVAPVGSAPDTTEPTTTDPVTTTGSTTTVPVVTEPSSTEPPTSVAEPPAGWAASNFVPGASVLGYSGNWAGEGGPSPAAPVDGAPPADGYYVASLREPWTPEQPDVLAVRVERLDWCTDLPDGCAQMEPDEMNIDPSWHLDLDVPLDGTTDVIVQGFRCWNDDQQKQATGTELRELFEAYTADYTALIAPQLTGTTADWEVANAVAAAPSGGFVGEESICGPDSLAGVLRYVHDPAPVLLLQTVTDWDGGPLDATDLVQLDGVQYTDGTPVFYFYAGFYS